LSLHAFSIALAFLAVGFAQYLVVAVCERLRRALALLMMVIVVEGQPVHLSPNAANARGVTPRSALNV
jgi:hypothetical protein